MEPSTLAPRPKKPPRWWVLVTIGAGIFGSLTAIAVAGTGTYDITPFKVEFRAVPAFLGKTELAIRPVQKLVPSHAEAGTHQAPMEFRATILSVSKSRVAADLTEIKTPYGLARKIADDGKGAIQAFAIKLALLALAGAGATGAAISFGRWRRLVGSMIVGALTFLIIGLLVQQTYNTSEFLKTSYRVDSGPDLLPSGLPSL